MLLCAKHRVSAIMENRAILLTPFWPRKVLEFCNNCEGSWKNRGNLTFKINKNKNSSIHDWAILYFRTDQSLLRKTNPPYGNKTQHFQGFYSLQTKFYVASIHHFITRSKIKLSKIALYYYFDSHPVEKRFVKIFLSSIVI